MSVSAGKVMVRRSLLRAVAVLSLLAVSSFTIGAASAHDFETIPHPDPDLASQVEKNAVFAFCPQVVRDGRPSRYPGLYGLRRNDEAGSRWEFTSSQTFLGSRIDVSPDAATRSCTVAIRPSAIEFDPTATRRVLEGGMRIRGYRLVDDSDGLRVFLKTVEGSGHVYVYSVSESSDAVTIAFLIEAG
ncbi:hypothetical protein [Erythrobacter sp.]|uniref:hypothetical protein n=1 Tax=Erythrobacter sp. TaxID=1042 RepID=UPI001425D795|nr:hypothetical protein [Erythrobacter sp.]QIQ85608.1 MAG: hypothetical protein G9473_02100 [Erythrobacter sp.]